MIIYREIDRKENHQGFSSKNVVSAKDMILLKTLAHKYGTTKESDRINAKDILLHRPC